MAERRMFAKAIINSARFLRMPTSSRLLYYDLGMSADDDGVVEAFTVMRTTGATEDDLRVLSAKGFVSILNDDLVTIITDWKQNNQIRSDRYKPSVYAHLLVKIEDGIPNDNQMATDGIPMVSKRETQYRLGKDSIDKVSIRGAGENPAPKRKRFTPPTIEMVSEYIQAKGYTVDPERFIDHYTANGWKVGRNSMKDWQSTVRSWHRRNQEAIPTSAKPYTPQSYTPIVSHDDSLNMSDVYDM